MSKKYFDLNFSSPADRSTSGLGIWGESLTYSGKAKFNVELCEAPCLTLALNDTLTGSFIASGDTVTNDGTATFTVTNGTLTCSSAGTVYNLHIEHLVFPCIEQQGTTIYSTTGLELTNSDSTPDWSATQNDYFFEAGIDLQRVVHTWYVRPSGGSYGSEDGTSYDDAWNGVSSIVWGHGGVLPGDSISGCSDVYDETFDETLTVGYSGADGNRIKIKNFNFTGSKIIPSSAWSDEGGGIYLSNNYAVGVFEDGIPLEIASDATLSNGNWFYEYSGGSDNLYYRPTSGTPGNHVVKKRYRGRTIDVHGKSHLEITDSAFTQGSVGVYNNVSGTAVDDLVISGCNFSTYAFGFRISANGANNSNITINNNTISYNGESISIQAESDTVKTVNLTISNNTITNTGYISNGKLWNDCGSNIDGEALGLQNIDTGTISGNTINTSVKDGIVLYSHSAGLIKDVEVNSNIISDCVDKGIVLGLVGTDNNTGNIISRNIVSGCGNGIKYQNSHTPGNTIANNTLIDCTYNLYDYNADYYVVKNNISYNTSGEHVHSVDDVNTNMDIDYNCYYPDVSGKFKINGGSYNFASWQSALSQDANGIASNPLLDSDYKLQQGSPCIDKGTTISGVTDGYFNTAPDIGAYERTEHNTWYVRPSGGSYGSEDGTSYDDAWDGFSNITWGSGGVLAGDTLYVCGTHNEQLTVGNSGASGNYINIKGDYSEEAGLINRNDAGSSYGIRGMDYQYIKVDSLTISNCERAIRNYVTSSETTKEKHWLINNCVIHDCSGTAGVDFRGTYVTITNNTIYNMAYDAIYCEGDNFTATYNTIYDVGITNDGDGIQITASDNCVVSYNTITSQNNNPHSGIAATGAGGTITIEHNTIAMNASPDYPSGIYCEYSDPTINNNIIHGGYYGINFLGGTVYRNITYNNTYAGIWSHANNDKAFVYNNVSHDNTRGLRIQYDSKEADIYNNIFYSNTYGISCNTTGTKVSDYNCFYDNTTDVSGVTEGSHSLYTDPLLDSDYKLQQGSPCIDKGTVISGVTDGYHGTAPDIGYDESNF